MQSYNSLCLKVTGQSHINQGKICQDSCISMQYDNYLIIAVADGHGSDKCFRSHLGSKFACEAAIETAEQVFHQSVPELSYFDSDKTKLQVAKSILTKWHKKVDEHLEANIVKKDEIGTLKPDFIDELNKSDKLDKLYGSTLIVTMLCSKWLMTLQIGDGKVTFFDKDGKSAQPVKWDDKCFFNATTSLCDKRAIEEFRFYVTGEFPFGILINTDGFDDSFEQENNISYIGESFNGMIQEILDEGEEIALHNINKYLEDLTYNGSGDDISIAMIYDEDYIYEYIMAIHKKRLSVGLNKIIEYKKKEIRYLENKRNEIDEKITFQVLSYYNIDISQGQKKRFSLGLLKLRYRIMNEIVTKNTIRSNTVNNDNNERLVYNTIKKMHVEKKQIDRRIVIINGEIEKLMKLD